MGLVWDAGDTTERIALNLEAFMMHWMYSEDYKGRLPDEHIHIVPQGERQDAGVNIVIVMAADEGSGWPYKDSEGRLVLEEVHQVGLVVKADKSSGGVDAVNKVHSILRSLFSADAESVERADLIARGIYNVFEVPDAIQVDPGSEDEEGTFYSRSVALTCNTDVFLK